MKTFKISLLAVCMLVVSLCMNTVSAQSKLDSWPQIKEFHKVMAQTFHPSEEGNFEPIKKRSGEMVEKANALTAQAIPTDFNTDKIKDAVARLQKGSKELDELIKKGASDKKIAKKLASLHEVFHEIVGLCSHVE